LTTSATKSSATLPIFFHLRWVAKIAVSVGLLAVIGLVVELFLITDDQGEAYRHVILASNLTHEALAPAIIVFGLALTIIACIIAWLVTLYGSFRIAGPMYRFSQNMKRAIEDPSSKPVSIRHGDMLQDEWLEFESSLTSLDGHYRHLRAAVTEARSRLPSDGEPGKPDAAEALARLRETERLVKL
jgi:hypothetical protein